jgi:hypothetical protein
MYLDAYWVGWGIISALISIGFAAVVMTIYGIFLRIKLLLLKREFKKQKERQSQSQFKSLCSEEIHY